MCACGTFTCSVCYGTGVVLCMVWYDMLSVARVGVVSPLDFVVEWRTNYNM